MQRLRYAKGYFPGKRGERQFFSCLRSGINVYLSPGPTDRRTTCTELILFATYLRPIQQLFYYSSDHVPVAGQSLVSRRTSAMVLHLVGDW